MGSRVPKRAVSQGPRGPFVYVVEDGAAQVRQVRLGQELAQGWVVREGLRGGDRVVATSSHGSHAELFAVSALTTWKIP